MQQLDSISESAPDWEQLRPVLDEAMSELDETDYDALVLRFFKNQDLRSVGLAQGVSDDTAQKRVSRALDKLRDYLSRRGIRTTTTALSVALTANAVQAAPFGLAVAISSAAAIAGTTITTAATASATKVIAMTTLQKTVVTATVAVLAGLGIYEARQASQLRDQVQSLQQQQAPLAELNSLLQRERDDASRQLAALREENDRLNQNAAELLRLRGEVGRLRADSRELAGLKSSVAQGKLETEDEAWVKRIRLLKQRVEQTAEAQIPELQFLTEQNWMEAARGKLETDEDWQRAFRFVRSSAQGRFMDEIRPALQKYLTANSNQFPTEILQLSPFFEKPPGDEVLLRYQVVPASSKPLASPSEKTEGWVITPKYQEAGEFIALGQDGGVSHAHDSPEMRILAPAIQAMMDATPVINGRRSADMRQLGPYLKTPEEKAAFERLMGKDK